MLKKALIAIALALFCASLLASPSFAMPSLGGVPSSDCTSGGGSWSGSTSVDGTCNYPPGTAKFAANCTTVHTSFEEFYDSAALISSGCVEPDPEPISTQDGEGSSTLSLGGDKNGSATFPPGACPQKCTISPTLPAGAKNSLPEDALATLYVRVVDEGGTAGEGSYTVCFENPNGAALIIYRYIGGSWVAVRSASSNPICTTARGEGAFYLGD